LWVTLPKLNCKPKCGGSEYDDENDGTENSSDDDNDDDDDDHSHLPTTKEYLTT
jgi:hypothetical protein